MKVQIRNYGIPFAGNIFDFRVILYTPT